MRNLQGYGCGSRRSELHPSEQHCFQPGMLVIGACMHILRHQCLRQLPASKLPSSNLIYRSCMSLSQAQVVLKKSCDHHL